MSTEGIVLNFPTDPHHFYTPDNSFHHALADGQTDVLTVPNELRTASGPSTPVPVSKHESPTPMIAEEKFASDTSASPSTAEPSNLLRKALLKDQPSDPLTATPQPPPAAAKPQRHTSSLFPTDGKFRPVHSIRSRARSSPANPTDTSPTETLSSKTGEPGVSKKPSAASRHDIFASASLNNSVASLRRNDSNASMRSNFTTHSFEDSGLQDPMERVVKERSPATQEWVRAIGVLSTQIGIMLAEGDHGCI